MPLEGRSRTLFEELKYKHGFPPRRAAAEVKAECALHGLGRSGALVVRVAELYLESVKAILDEFAREVVAKREMLGLRSGVQLHDTVSSALRGIFTEAGSALRQELVGQGEAVQLGIETLEQRGSVWQHLERMIGLLEAEDQTRETKDPEKEREQKFGILLSPGQAERDFEAWAVEARTLGTPIGVLFVDIDRFKLLNERFTHTEIDKTILPEVQRLLTKLVHSRGEAYRHGGEEFLLIMPNVDRREAEAFAEKVRATFEAHEFKVGGEVVPVTVSVGVAVWPDSGNTYDEVLGAANRAEVEAKKTRNTVRVAGPPGGLREA
jgi:diguanylate cyclase (GGDEF)-like protein